MDYLTIEGEASATVEIRHSVFICSVSHIESFDMGLEYVKVVANKYSDARHNCYAIITRLGEQKFSDDGEPQGTAGMPILQTIKNKNLLNIVAVVTRYFGGIKLGASGLIGAYTKAVSQALESAKIIQKKECYIGQAVTTYAEHQSFLRQIRDTEVTVLDTRYGDSVEFELGVPTYAKEEADKLYAKTTNGQRAIVWQEKRFLKY
ncbi:YigZ family protein [bacterium]|nr:YigZ family protein [bacterium]